MKKIWLEKKISLSDILIHPTQSLISCPICGDEYNHFEAPKHFDGENNYKATDMVKGDLISIKMRCEYGKHEWYLEIGFHKGHTLIWTEFETELDYHEYIKSPEWREKAEDAKHKAGWRCQLCNREGDSSTLHAHHRTYERLGEELPEDITILCSKCHAKFHDVEIH